MLRGTILAVSITLAFFAIAGTANIAEGGDPGMVVVAVGGGSVEEAMFQSGNLGEATFSFFAGYDKHGDFKGSFLVKRVFTGSGVRSIKSTEITDVQTGFDGCAWMRMTGVATFHATWTPKPVPDHTFILQVWDCDNFENGGDVIWFEVSRPSPNGTARPALSLLEPCEVEAGNILVQEDSL